MNLDDCSRDAHAQLEAFMASPSTKAGSMPLVDNILEIPAARNTAEFINTLPASPQFHAIERVFHSYPPNSLLSSIGRAFLYSLIRYLKPDQVIEIGTYQGGTAEVMARALHANGKGKLTTADPFPTYSTPHIALWPSELKDRAHFIHGNSMNIFMDLEQKSRGENASMIDMIFVDGHHDFEYALFDLSMSARYIKPGGIVVMDNAELTGVFWAVKEFLRLNPAWHEIGSALSAHSDSAPFESMGSSFPQTAFLILQAPMKITFGRVPTSYIGLCPHLDQCDGISLSFAPPSSSGTLHLRVFLRTFYHHELGKFPDQKVASVSGRIKAGDTDCRLTFESSINIPRYEGEILRHFELLAIWQPDEGSDASKNFLLRWISRLAGSTPPNTDASLQLNQAPEAFGIS